MIPTIPTRSAGLFVPVFALRSTGDLGVGDTGSLREMVDWCAETGFKVLQILPINETSDDNSPYNAISSLALDITTLAISPDLIPGLSKEAFQAKVSPEFLKCLRDGSVQYRSVKSLKWSLCEDAFEAFSAGHASQRDQAVFEQFLLEEKKWIDDYALFRALVELNGHPAWERWPEGQRSPSLACGWWASLAGSEFEGWSRRVRFYSFVQWLLYRQWAELARYAEWKGVNLMGDMPFGVSRHSADVWAQPEQFDLGWSGGAPPEPMFQPDAFTAKWGQNWGVPIYRWDQMEKNNYAWWRTRVRGVARFFKLFRIDHVLGFYRVFSFPWQPQENGAYTELSMEEAFTRAGDLPRFLPHDDTTPENQLANQRHGETILKMIKEAAGDSLIVAEDLGVVPDYVRPSLLGLGMSGFKIPMFEREENTREYKNPKTYAELTVATLSTHDHETMAGIWDGWWDSVEKDLGKGKFPVGNEGLSEAGRQASWELYRTQRFCGLSDEQLIRSFEPQVREALIKTLLDSPSWLAIVMITDVFGLKMRFNVPGPVAESNWSQRLNVDNETLKRDSFHTGAMEFVKKQIQSAGR
ncbi:MAG: 4-alpha-glucanotransferase [Blastochloris sp.]|jgi:4-alpha-glucanotransferase|nr:4-alpha-glucanotransferase [Blastochloris sp.]